MIHARHNFENREALAQGLAQRVAQVLSRSVTLNGCAVLAVSGGTTPALFFSHLSHQPISWDKVAVTLVDERQVAETNPRSNAALVRKTLMVNEASAATFVPLYKNAQNAARLKPDCVVLGMGEDGHTASFFPGGDRLDAALDPNGKTAITEINAPGAGEPRLTFTLARLLQAATVCLHIEGARKQVVLEAALGGNDLHQMPVRAVLKSSHPVDVYWCP